MAGSSALKRYDHQWDIPEPFSAALFSEKQNQDLAIDGLTRFESLVVRSVREALSQCTIVNCQLSILNSFNLGSERVVFILSTTKANVEYLGREDASTEILYPGESAERIAGVLGVTTQPIVVCNACVSGLSAMILASRLLEQRQYDYAIVCGADVLSRFVMSGFLSLKSVSASSCRPFDIDRQGMNLGEAASTVILGYGDSALAQGSDSLIAVAGAVRNDAFDITAPSKKGEGAFRALKAVLRETEARWYGGAGVRETVTDQLALLNAHGVASLFMDQMESVAIERAGLAEVPVNSLKGFFGHTLGAAGVLETVLTMYALERGTIFGTVGYEELGVSGRIKVAAQQQATDKRCFIKMLSGFGGCNAALLVENFRWRGGAVARGYEDFRWRGGAVARWRENSASAEGNLAPPYPRTPVPPFLASPFLASQYSRLFLRCWSTEVPQGFTSCANMEDGKKRSEQNIIKHRGTETQRL